jgi:LysM repeat protein
VAINVPIVSQWNPKGVNAATKSIGGLEGAAKKLGGALAGVFAAQKIGQFFASSVKGAMEDQKAQIQLEKSIRNTTNATSQQIAGLEGFIRSTQFATGILDDQLRPSLNKLVLATGDVTQSQSLLNLALDISAGTGKDLESVTAALAKAAGGQTTALSKLGVGLDQSVLKSKDLDLITTTLSNKFSGQAAAAAQTFAGQMSILSAKAQDASETIGYSLIKAFEMFSGGGGAGVAFGDLLLKIADTISDFIIGVAVTIKSIKDFTSTLIDNNPILARFLEALGNVAKLMLDLMPFTSYIQGMVKVGQETKANELASKSAGDRYLLMAERLYGFKTATDKTIPTIEKATKATKGLSDAQKAVINTSIKMQETIVNTLQNSLNDAESKLNAITGKFQDFKDTISGSVTGIVDFAGALESGDFLQGLLNQAKNATTFADKIKQLINLGLSERAIRQVLDAGYDAGSMIADQIIAGGSTIVNQINTLMNSVEFVAETVGQLGAETFYQQGINQGQALVDGIKTALESAKAELDRLRESLTATGTAGTGTAGATAGAAASVAKTVVVKAGDSLSKIAAANNVSLQAILDANSKFTTDPKYNKGNTVFSGTTVKIPRLAKGGIVTGPTYSLIGEAGPEAVIPLSGKNAGMGATYNIVVNAGIGANGNQIGRDIVEAITRYERNSGQVFARA